MELENNPSLTRKIVLIIISLVLMGTLVLGANYIGNAYKSDNKATNSKTAESSDSNQTNGSDIKAAEGSDIKTAKGSGTKPAKGSNKKQITEEKLDSLDSNELTENTTTKDLAKEPEVIKVDSLSATEMQNNLERLSEEMSETQKKNDALTQRLVEIEKTLQERVKQLSDKQASSTK